MAAFTIASPTRTPAAVTTTQDISPGHQTIPFQYNASEFAYRFSLTPATNYLFVTGDQHVDPAPEGEDVDDLIDGLSPAWSSITITNDQSLFESVLTHVLPGTTVFKPAFHGNLRPAPRGGGGGGGTMPIYPWSGVAQDDGQFHIEPYVQFVDPRNDAVVASFTSQPAVPASTAWSLPAIPTQLDLVPPTTTGTDAAMVSTKASAVPAVNGIVETVKATRGGVQDTATVYGPYVDLIVDETEEGDEQAPGVWLSVGQTVTVEMDIKPSDLPDGDVILSVLGSAELGVSGEEATFGSFSWGLNDPTRPLTMELDVRTGGESALCLSYVTPSGLTFKDEVTLKAVNIHLTGKEPELDGDGNIVGYREVPEHVAEECGVYLMYNETEVIVEDPGTAEGTLTLSFDSAVIMLDGPLAPLTPTGAMMQIPIPCSYAVGNRLTYTVREGEPPIIMGAASGNEDGLADADVPATSTVVQLDHSRRSAPKALRLTDLTVEILEPDGLPIRGKVTKDSQSNYLWDSPFSFEWQCVHSSATEGYGIPFEADIDPYGATFGTLGDAMYHWSVNEGEQDKGLVTPDDGHFVTYEPQYASPPDQMEEVYVELRPFAGSDKRMRDRKIEVFRDHLARDMANFGAGELSFCGHPKCLDFRWSFDRYNQTWYALHSWNCFGSVWHMDNGSGSGYIDPIQDKGLEIPPLVSPTQWTAVADACDPIDWDAICAGVHRGDIIAYYGDEQPKPTLYHAAMLVTEGAGTTYGANNQPRLLDGGRADDFGNGGALENSPSFVWWQGDARTYYDELNKEMMDKAGVRVLYRVTVYRRKQ